MLATSKHQTLGTTESLQKHRAQKSMAMAIAAGIEPSSTLQERAEFLMLCWELGLVAIVRMMIQKQ